MNAEIRNALLTRFWIVLLLVWFLVSLASLPASANASEGDEVLAPMEYFATIERLKTLEQRIARAEAEANRAQAEANSRVEDYERQQRHQRNAQLNMRCSMAGSVPNWSTGGCL
jgi:hypothetical protein